MIQFTGVARAPAALDRFVNLGIRPAKLVGIFIGGQGSAQFLSLLSGFLALQWLVVDQYAAYGLVYSFQSTLAILTDLGCAGTVIGLVGNRVEDGSVIGAYIRAGRSIRTWLLSITAPIAVLSFFHLSSRLLLTTSTKVGLLLTIFISIYASGMGSFYGAPLLIRRQLGTYYRIHIVSAAGRVLGILVLHEVGQLSALTAALINASAILYAAIRCRFDSRSYITESRNVPRETVREMIRYVLPNVPSIVHFALQGQIAVFLIALWGQGRSIAQVSALSRLGQLVVFLISFNSSVLEPWLARTPARLFARRFAAALGVATLLSGILLLAAQLCPQAFLVLLGKPYSGLGRELWWLIASSCVYYLGNVIWTALLARRFIFWSGTWLNIALVTCAQVAFIAHSPISTTMEVVQFGFACSLASLVAYSATFIYGTTKRPTGRFPEVTQAAEQRESVDDNNVSEAVAQRSTL